MPDLAPSQLLPVIEVKELTHTYPNGFVSLKNVNITIQEGEFVGFIGQNGSGKTTLAKHFVGLLRSGKGKVFIEGQDNHKVPIVDLARKVGYVFQNADNQIFSSSVYDEVSYGPKNLGLGKEDLKARVEQSLTELSILHLKDNHPLSLSWGDRQKVAIASVLAMGPHIVILDEPTTGQDLRGGHEILKTCKRLNEQGKTIIVITHNMELVAEYCQKVYLLWQGEILAEGPTDNIFLDASTIKKSYITPPQITRLSALIAEEVSDFPPGVLTIDQMIKEIKTRIP
jgi:energy-coupling factor transporter ATP-binding protein EcfA2